MKSHRSKLLPSPGVLMELSISSGCGARMNRYVVLWTSLAASPHVGTGLGLSIGIRRRVPCSSFSRKNESFMYYSLLLLRLAFMPSEVHHLPAATAPYFWFSSHVHLLKCLSAMILLFLLSRRRRSWTMRFVVFQLHPGIERGFA